MNLHDAIPPYTYLGWARGTQCTSAEPNHAEWSVSGTHHDCFNNNRDTTWGAIYCECFMCGGRTERHYIRDIDAKRGGPDGYDPECAACHADNHPTPPTEGYR